MKKRLEAIERELLLIQKEENGYVPKPAIFDALKKKVGLKDSAKDWLSQQGQYYCVLPQSKIPDNWCRMI